LKDVAWENAPGIAGALQVEVVEHLKTDDIDLPVATAIMTLVRSKKFDLAWKKRGSSAIGPDGISKTSG